MGMSMQSKSPLSGTAPTSSTAAWQTRKQDFQNLSDALQSGNLDKAKSAYAQLVKDSPTKATQDPNSPLSQIGAALQNGDVAGAQKAMTAMKSHHGGHARNATPDTANTSTTSTPAVPNPTATMGNLVNTLV